MRSNDFDCSLDPVKLPYTHPSQHMSRIWGRGMAVSSRRLHIDQHNPLEKEIYGAFEITNLQTKLTTNEPNVQTRHQDHIRNNPYV